VSAERRLDVLARFASAQSSEPNGARLCEVAAEVVDVTGAGVTLISQDTSTSTVCATDAVSALVEELQFSLGEGPCLDAFREDRPVVEPDLAHPATVRWMAFTPPALEAGVRSIFGFPLHIGAVRLGALDLYCDHTGALSDEQYGDALVVADVVAASMATMQADAAPGSLSEQLGSRQDFRIAVHQAAGMVSVQLGVPIDEAVVRLRAHAFAVDLPVSEVARRIVARQLRLDQPTDDATA
jgi:GAF domain-containing protein